MRWYDLHLWSYQFLHSSDCTISVAEGIRQPTHSITSLPVSIETDGNASTGGRQKERVGETGEEEGLA